MLFSVKILVSILVKAPGVSNISRLLGLFHRVRYSVKPQGVG